MKWCVTFLSFREKILHSHLYPCPKGLLAQCLSKISYDMSFGICKSIINVKRPFLTVSTKQMFIGGHFINVVAIVMWTITLLVEWNLSIETFSKFYSNLLYRLYSFKLVDAIHQKWFCQLCNTVLQKRGHTNAYVSYGSFSKTY